MLVLFDLMGGVVLLLWGLYMVYSGILCVFGLDFRCLFGKVLSNCISVFVVGLGFIVLF